MISSLCSYERETNIMRQLLYYKIKARESPCNLLKMEMAGGRSCFHLHADTVSESNVIKNYLCYAFN